jgi:hypothetical protein
MQGGEVITTKLLERLERIARKSHEQEVEDGYTICFKVCPTCGFASWSCSKEAHKGFKVEAEEITQHDDPCKRCQIAYQRAPEVFNWVMGVFNHSEELHESDEHKVPE